jgi:hypothetical protein
MNLLCHKLNLQHLFSRIGWDTIETESFDSAGFPGGSHEALVSNFYPAVSGQLFYRRKLSAHISNESQKAMVLSNLSTTLLIFTEHLAGEMKCFYNCQN